jgi:hypothetical protein
MDTLGCLRETHWRHLSSMSDSRPTLQSSLGEASNCLGRQIDKTGHPGLTELCSSPHLHGATALFQCAIHSQWYQQSFILRSPTLGPASCKQWLQLEFHRSAQKQQTGSVTHCSLFKVHECPAAKTRAARKVHGISSEGREVG